MIGNLMIRSQYKHMFADSNDSIEVTEIILDYAKRYTAIKKKLCKHWWWYNFLVLFWIIFIEENSEEKKET